MEDELIWWYVMQLEIRDTKKGEEKALEDKKD
jgi:hypothetical protein